MRKTIGSPEHEAILNVLRELRISAGLSQMEVAARLDEPQSFVSKYETGERRLDVLELRQIAAALGSDLATVVAKIELVLKP